MKTGYVIKQIMKSTTERHSLSIMASLRKSRHKILRYKHLFDDIL